MWLRARDRMYYSSLKRINTAKADLHRCDAEKPLKKKIIIKKRNGLGLRRMYMVLCVYFNCLCTHFFLSRHFIVVIVIHQCDDCGARKRIVCMNSHSESGRHAWVLFSSWMFHEHSQPLYVSITRFSFSLPKWIRGQIRQLHVYIFVWHELSVQTEHKLKVKFNQCRPVLMRILILPARSLLTNAPSLPRGTYEKIVLLTLSSICDIRPEVFTVDRLCAPSQSANYWNKNTQKSDQIHNSEKWEKKQLE